MSWLIEINTLEIFQRVSVDNLLSGGLNSTQQQQQQIPPQPQKNQQQQNNKLNLYRNIHLLEH